MSISWNDDFISGEKSVSVGPFLQLCSQVIVTGYLIRKNVLEEVHFHCLAVISSWNNRWTIYCSSLPKCILKISICSVKSTVRLLLGHRWIVVSLRCVHGYETSRILFVVVDEQHQTCSRGSYTMITFVVNCVQMRQPSHSSYTKVIIRNWNLRTTVQFHIQCVDSICLELTNRTVKTLLTPTLCWK